MKTKEELENEIKVYQDFIQMEKQSIDASKEIIERYEAKISFWKKELEQLTSFKRNPKYILKVLETVEYEDNNVLINKLDATLAMIDLANWCNVRCQKENDDSKASLGYDMNSGEIKFYRIGDIMDSVVIFNSVNSANLAISEINKSPELTRLAKIFLGVNNE